MEIQQQFKKLCQSIAMSARHLLLFLEARNISYTNIELCAKIKQLIGMENRTVIK